MSSSSNPNQNLTNYDSNEYILYDDFFLRIFKSDRFGNREYLVITIDNKQINKRLNNEKKYDEDEEFTDNYIIKNYIFSSGYKIADEDKKYVDELITLHLEINPEKEEYKHFYISNGINYFLEKKIIANLFKKYLSSSASVDKYEINILKRWLTFDIIDKYINVELYNYKADKQKEKVHFILNEKNTKDGAWMIRKSSIENMSNYNYLYKLGYNGPNYITIYFAISLKKNGKVNDSLICHKIGVGFYIVNKDPAKNIIFLSLIDLFDYYSSSSILDKQKLILFTKLTTQNIQEELMKEVKSSNSNMSSPVVPLPDSGGHEQLFKDIAEYVKDDKQSGGGFYFNKYKKYKMKYQLKKKYK